MQAAGVGGRLEETGMFLSGKGKPFGRFRISGSNLSYAAAGGKRVGPFLPTGPGGCGAGEGKRQGSLLGPASCVVQLCGLPAGRHPWDPRRF